MKKPPKADITYVRLCSADPDGPRGLSFTVERGRPNALAKMFIAAVDAAGLRHTYKGETPEDAR